MVAPNLTSGGLLKAGNTTNHREILQPVIDRALTDERIDALVVPIGKGILLRRKQ